MDRIAALADGGCWEEVAALAREGLTTGFATPELAAVLRRAPAEVRRSSEAFRFVAALIWSRWGLTIESRKPRSASAPSDESPATLALWGLGHGRFGQASEFDAFIQATHDKDSHPSCRPWLGVSALLSGLTPDMVGDALERDFKVAQHSADPWFVTAASIAYGFVYCLRVGRHEEGMAALESGVERLQGMGCWYGACHLIMNQVVIEAMRGNLASAEGRLRALVPWQRHLEKSFVGVALEHLPWIVAVERRDPRIAGTRFSLDYRTCPAQMRPWLLRTFIRDAVLCNQLHRVREPQRQMEEVLAEDGCFYAAECWLAVATWSEAKGWFETGLEQASKALDIARTCGMRFCEMQALTHQAWCLRHYRNRHWQEDAAATCTRLALVITRACGYHAWWQSDPTRHLHRLLQTWGLKVPLYRSIQPEHLEQVESLLPRLSDPVLLPASPPTRSEWRLTERQWIVLGYLAAGLTPAAMTAKTIQAMGTLRREISFLLERFQAESVSRMVEKASRLGLVRNMGGGPRLPRVVLNRKKQPIGVEI